MTTNTDVYPVDDRGYCNTPDASVYMQMSESKMNKDRHYGVGAEFVKFGKSVRYSYAALDAEAAKNRRTCTRENPAAA